MGCNAASAGFHQHTQEGQSDRLSRSGYALPRHPPGWKVNCVRPGVHATVTIISAPDCRGRPCRMSGAFPVTLLDLAGSIALLLWGVRMVQTGMQRTFGARLRSVLGAAL